jgi:VacB/RNase II family 3'-5' exoribonuclease
MNDRSRSRTRLAAIARRAMIDRGLEPDFSPAALAEVRALGVAPEHPESVRDLRKLPWCSIDNDDSRDLDQLSVAEPASDGATILRVAVADVDALVKKGSAVDAHAATNTTSVYTAAGIFPMLPEKLSTDLTSLNENEDRAAVIVEMTVGADGSVGAADVHRALVRNHAKLAYNAVAAWLDGGEPDPGLGKALAAVPELADQLRSQDRLAQAMRGLRHERGALSLRTPEARPVFEGDALADLRTDVPNRAKELIEEFMVAANGVVARFLEARGFASVRRVLRSPERWERIRELAAAHGERLPEAPGAAALEAFLMKRRDADPDRFADLSLSIVKLLGRGEYALERPGELHEGHFGLSTTDYAHSTAPNRRFPDLLTQRLVKAALAGVAAPYGDEQLRKLAEHCTEQENNASKVERRVRKSAAALLLASRIGERFDAIVTGANEKDTWVRIDRPAVEGRLSEGAEGLDVGDRIRVQLTHTDVERGFVDFERTKG